MERLKGHVAAVFVTGDFNTSESSPTMTFFHGRTALTNDSGELMENPKPLVDAYRFIHPESTRRLIDHVLVGPDIRIRHAGRIASGKASDHNVIWAEVLID
jgi:endonuclease/exonuclease/phosphatase family metal-dependent hydrolase